jgi:mRNA-degrading endonuclease RelE of RelBE toxin-antitoxin system
MVRDAIERHLRYAPRKTSRSRIKRLRGLQRPQFRLRVDEIRVFYDVTATTVEILAIIEKRQAQAWRADSGTPDPDGGAGKG